MSDTPATESEKQEARKRMLRALEHALKQQRELRPRVPGPDYSQPEFSDPAWLREWMKQLDVNQSDLAREAEVSQPFISAILQGTKPFSEPSRTQIWRVIHRLHKRKAEQDEQKMLQDFRRKIEAGLMDSPSNFAPFFPLSPLRFKTPLELKDEEIELLTKERDLAREQCSTLKQLLDMDLVNRCAELEKKLADAFQQIADFHRLFAFKGAAVAGDELQSQLEHRGRDK